MPSTIRVGEARFSFSVLFPTCAFVFNEPFFETELFFLYND